MTIATYLQRTDILLNTRFVIDTTGNGYYIQGGVKYTRDEFKRKHPLPISLVLNNKLNSDKTKSFLGAD